MTTYLFGVIENGGRLNFGELGFTGPYGDRAEIKTIPFGGISMAVCEVDGWKVDEANKADLLNKLLEHQKTLEKIMQQQFILPVKFGTTVEAEQDVTVILSRYHELLKKGLEEMRDFIEADVVVTWDTTSEIRKLAAGDEEIMRLKAQAEKLPPDKRGQKIIEVGMCLEEKLSKHRKEIEKEIHKELKKRCLDMVEHECLEDRMVINCSFLLKKGEEGGFFNAIDALDKKLDGTFKFKCLYPLPPHSFKTIVIKKVEREVLLEAKRLFGVTDKMTLKDLKDKNRELIKKYHPDKAAGKAAAATFEQVGKSYALLCNVIGNERPFSDFEINRCYVVDFQEGER